MNGEAFAFIPWHLSEYPDCIPSQCYHRYHLYLWRHGLR